MKKEADREPLFYGLPPMIGFTGTTGVTIGAKQVADAAERSAVVIAYGVTTLDDALLVGFRLSVAGRSRRKGARFASKLVSDDEIHTFHPPSIVNSR